jgi:mannose/cellobiose epimerase-like protein (N-acyl-D-glucosamine 2-epimerase family)
MNHVNRSRLRHLVPIGALKRVGKGLLQPHGKTRLFDDLVLLLWEGYANAKRGLHFMRDNETGTNGAIGTTAPEQRTERFQSPSFWREHILNNLLPFWEKHSIDYEFGGFRVPNVARNGQAHDAGAERAPEWQARMVYGFSVGYDVGQHPSHLRTAAHGVQFLMDKLWDRQFGGWHGGIYPDGRVAREERKVSTQAYTLVGLLEYYRVTREPAVLQRVVESYELLERHAWDRDGLGYYQGCNRDWTVRSDRKTLCVQLAAFSAVLSLYRVTGEAMYLARLQQLADLMSSRMRDRKYRCALEMFDRNWHYQAVAVRDKIEVGHNLKAGRLLLELYQLTQDQAHFTPAKELIDYCVEHGWDNRHQGFYYHLYRNGRVGSGEKGWWGESEGLPALLLLHKLSGESLYLDYFTKLAQFCFRHFVDPEYGEWFKWCYANGRVKNSDKRDAFHTVQASWYASRYLAEIQQAAAASR